VQLLYNNKRGTPGLDAPTTSINGFVPEVRYYLRKKEDLRKKPFVAAFVELYNLKIYPGMPEFNLNYTLNETNGDIISFGVLLGKNIAIGNHFLLDLFIGYKYKLIDGSKTYRNIDGSYFDVAFSDQGSGVRLGVNIGYSF